MLKIQRRKKKLKRKKRKMTEVDYALVFSLSLMLLIFFQLTFSFWEKNQGLVAGSSSDSIKVTVDVVPSISIDSPSDISLSPNIQETGTSTGNATWNVKPIMSLAGRWKSVIRPVRPCKAD